MASQPMQKCDVLKTTNAVGQSPNLERDLAAQPPCHPRACAIQGGRTPEYLTDNYNQDRCQHLIDALYDCCAAFYDRQGDGASTVSCPKPALLRLKLSQRKTS